MNRLLQSPKHEQPHQTPSPPLPSPGITVARATAKPLYKDCFLRGVRLSFADSLQP